MQNNKNTKKQQRLLNERSREETFSREDEDERRESIQVPEILIKR